MLLTPIPAFMQSASAAVSTWNPAHIGTHFTLTNGNNTVTQSAGGTAQASVIGILGQSSGKRYFEVILDTIVGPSDVWVGLSENYVPDVSLQNASYVDGGAGAGSFATFQNGSVFTLGGSFFHAGSLSSGAVIGCAVGFSAGKVWFSLGGDFTAFGGASANPATGAAPCMTFTAPIGSLLFPAFSCANSNEQATLAASSTLSFSIPSGYTAWNA